MASWRMKAAMEGLVEGVFLGARLIFMVREEGRESRSSDRREGVGTCRGAVQSLPAEVGAESALWLFKCGALAELVERREPAQLFGRWLGKG